MATFSENNPYKQVSFRNIWPFTKVTRMRKLECMMKLSIFVFTPAHAKCNTDFFFFNGITGRQHCLRRNAMGVWLVTGVHWMQRKDKKSAQWQSSTNVTHSQRRGCKSIISFLRQQSSFRFYQITFLHGIPLKYHYLCSKILTFFTVILSFKTFAKHKLDNIHPVTAKATVGMISSERQNGYYAQLIFKKSSPVTHAWNTEK